MSKYHVGQRVWIFHLYGRKDPHEGEVVKVGRTLVHVRPSGFTLTDVFRMESGWANGEHRNSWIKTDQDLADDERRAGLMDRLRAAGFNTLTSGIRPPLDHLERVVLAAEATS